MCGGGDETENQFCLIWRGKVQSMMLVWVRGAARTLCPAASALSHERKRQTRISAFAQHLPRGAKRAHKNSPPSAISLFSAQKGIELSIGRCSRVEKNISTLMQLLVLGNGWLSDSRVATPRASAQSCLCIDKHQATPCNHNPRGTTPLPMQAINKPSRARTEQVLMVHAAPRALSLSLFALSIGVSAPMPAPKAPDRTQGMQSI